MARRRTTELVDDPTVAEVRRWRARMVKDAGGTLEGLVAMLRGRSASRAASGNGKVSAKPAGKTTSKGRSSARKRRAATSKQPSRPQKRRS